MRLRSRRGEEGCTGLTKREKKRMGMGRRVGKVNWFMAGYIHLPLHLNGEFGVIMGNQCAEFFTSCITFGILGELSLDSR